MKLFPVLPENSGNVVAGRNDDMIEKNTRQVMSHIPLRIPKRSYEHMTLGSRLAYMYSILGIDPSLVACWNLKSHLRRPFGGAVICPRVESTLCMRKQRPKADSL